MSNPVFVVVTYGLAALAVFALFLTLSVTSSQRRNELRKRKEENHG